MNKPGVIYMIAHLIITMAIITAYFVKLILTGESDETLRLAVIVVIGYWFGAMQKDTVTNILTKGKDKENE